MTDLVAVLTTFPAEGNGNDGAAESLAHAVVEEGLAACVNLLPPMTSVYRWKGTVERSVERQLIMKTTRARLDALRARVLALHPYELPEWIVVPVADASEAYGAWLRAETAAPGDA